MDILTSDGLTPRSRVDMDMQVNPQQEVGEGEGGEEGERGGGKWGYIVFWLYLPVQRHLTQIVF